MRTAQSPPDLQSPNTRYVDIGRRLAPTAAMGATAITALMVVATWGQWRRVGMVILVMAVLIGFNLWVNLASMARGGRSIDIARSVVNIATLTFVNHVSGWPMPGWLWLPYLALRQDHFDAEIAFGSVVSLCLVEDGVSLLDGISWIYPLSFTLLAALCTEFSRIRFSAIRDMLAESDAQRLELERAHSSLRKNHEQLTTETRERQRMEIELRQAQKLESVGRLASGVAHEINTPVQFVSDSVHFVREAVLSYSEVIGKLQVVMRSVLSGAPTEVATTEANAAKNAFESGDLDYMLERVPKALDRSLEGLARIATIVRSMKEFAHPDGTGMACADLNRAIESTLTIARGEYKDVADVETDLGDIPHVMCRLGDVNQAILNILVNASHAIEASRRDGERGRIGIRTRLEGHVVEITISDTGGGIPADIQDKIYDPFFTTKAVGKGTGQGLAIARSVIEERHAGELRFETRMGKGTIFTMRLPVDGKYQEGAALFW